MNLQLFTNSAKGTMSGTLAQGGTTMVLSAGEGNKLPAPAAGEHFILTIYEKDVSNNEERVEIVSVTGRTADTLTLGARDYEGTVGVGGGYAYPSSVGKTVYWALRLTAAGAAEFMQKVSTHAATSKATPVDADEIPLFDSAASFGLKKLTWANLKATAKTYFDTLYAAIGHNHSGTYEPAITTLANSKGGTGQNSSAWTGLVKAVAGVWSTATPGTDYLAPPSGTAMLKANSGGALSNAVAGTDYQAPIGTISGIAKGNGANALAAATAGTDYVAPGTTSTFSAYQVFGKAVQETKTAMGANDIDLRAGNYFSKTISGNTTLTVSNVPSTGTVASFILDLTNGGSATVTWWSGMKWAGGTAPTLTSSGRDVLGFFTHDGGTTWTGLVLGKDVK